MRPMKLRRNILAFLFLASSTGTLAQKYTTGNWFIYFGNQPITKKWNWHNEVQYRNYNFAGDLQQLLLRTGIGYNLSENNNNILLGYGFIHSQRYLANGTDKEGNNEHRVFQQFITKQNFGRFYLLHRYRIEERFLVAGYQTRFRYFLALNVAVTRKTMDKNTFYLSAYNEVFIHGRAPLFDRNRLYGAIGYMINKNLKVEAGFMAQTLETTNRNQFQVVIFNNIPFRNN
jgi:hypothetical protein